jgi:hypothetical protein
MRHENYSVRQSEGNAAPYIDGIRKVPVVLTPESLKKLIDKDISECLEKYVVQNGKSKYKLIFDEKEISVSEVCTTYFSNPETCFKMRNTYDNIVKSTDIPKDVSNFNTESGATSVNSNLVQMPHPHCGIASDMSPEQRQVRVKELIGKGYSRRKVAKMLDIDERTVRRDLEGAASVNLAQGSSVGLMPHPHSPSTAPVSGATSIAAITTVVASLVLKEQQLSLPHPQQQQEQE